ncbi:recombinase family protein [Ligilactobacillus ruminis]
MKNHHPAIISDEVFETVQKAMKDRSNVAVDKDGVHRAKKGYSSKK